MSDKYNLKYSNRIKLFGGITTKHILNIFCSYNYKICLGDFKFNQDLTLVLIKIEMAIFQ